MSTTEAQEPSVAETYTEGMSIHQRLGRILAEMPAIGKGQRNEQQGFMFRGHDDVMNALNPLLSKYGVFFVPRVLERVTDQRTTRQGGTMYEVNLHVEFTFYGPDGDFVEGSTWGEGTDSGDKSTNKAMTMALKNMLAQTFAVSTQEISQLDADQHSPDATTGRTSQLPFTSSGRVQLRPGAPLGWTAINAALKEIDAAMPWSDWVTQALLHLAGAEKLADLSVEQKRDCGILIANGVAHLVDTMAGREFPPPTRAEVADAFAWADSVDTRLAGPAMPLDPDEAAALEAAVASAKADTGSGQGDGGDGAEDATDAPLGPMPKGSGDEGVEFGPTDKEKAP